MAEQSDVQAQPAHLRVSLSMTFLICQEIEGTRCAWEHLKVKSSPCCQVKNSPVKQEGHMIPPPPPGASGGQPQPIVRWPSGGFHPHPPYPGDSREAGLSHKVVWASSGKGTETLDNFPPVAIPSCRCRHTPSTATAFSDMAACSAREQRNQAVGSNGAQWSQNRLWPRWFSSCSNGLENVPLGRNDFPVVSPHWPVHLMHSFAWLLHA